MFLPSIVSLSLCSCLQLSHYLCVPAFNCLIIVVFLPSIVSLSLCSCLQLSHYSCVPAFNCLIIVVFLPSIHVCSSNETASFLKLRLFLKIRCRDVFSLDIHILSDPKMCISPIRVEEWQHEKWCQEINQ